MRPPSFLEPLLPKPWQEHSDIEKILFKSFIAFAAGDAFGAFYEFAEITAEIPNQLRGKPGWPAGGISDDTMLTLLTLEALQKPSPTEAAAEFLRLLRVNQERLRGLGPTTRLALGMEVKSGEISSLGDTNGGMMRTVLLSMALHESERRTDWLQGLIQATHKGARALKGSIALAELIHSSPSERTKILVVDRDFSKGVSNDSLETYEAVCMILTRARSLEEIFKFACSMGGDTDTTSAISAAIHTFWNPLSDEVFQLDWLKDVDWSELVSAPSSLAALYEMVDE